ncbi:hypothetical protein ElyMa_006734500 [Elysia marginata]|uniref:Uncharacterized protein n=1 Tax=Elysia marginata TaxID=1093978 RepID=A0AAV4IX53_9GAST|nr:hypothetical protein ElyMa_006734500 [Elysia marginata]
MYPGEEKNDLGGHGRKGGVRIKTSSSSTHSPHRVLRVSELVRCTSRHELFMKQGVRVSCGVLAARAGRAGSAHKLGKWINTASAAAAAAAAFIVDWIPSR